MDEHEIRANMMDTIVERIEVWQRYACIYNMDFRTTKQTLRVIGDERNYTYDLMKSAGYNEYEIDEIMACYKNILDGIRETLGEQRPIDRSKMKIVE